jgi:hypothetical protein
MSDENFPRDIESVPTPTREMFLLDEMLSGEGSALLQYANKITGQTQKTEDSAAPETLAKHNFAAPGHPGDTFVKRKVKEAADNFTALDAPALQTKK